MKSEDLSFWQTVVLTFKIVTAMLPSIILSQLTEGGVFMIVGMLNFWLIGYMGNKMWNFK
jgi:hypothetical protein